MGPPGAVLGANRSCSGLGLGSSQQNRLAVPRASDVQAASRRGRSTPTIAMLRQGQGALSSRLGRAATSSRSSAASSAAFGSRVVPAGVRATRAPRIHGAVVRRGNRIVISAVLADVEDAVDVRSLLDDKIRGEPNLVTGHLDNGFQYVILPNKLPPTRFEAHLEIHAGSVDELPNEQGIAHLVEHVTFLGSKRRENLLGTGARANAYTDFHHTVFHVHAPITNSVTGAPMLPQVLEALEEIAFQPEFLPNRIEKERKAVMAEAQMMNTIEYRVDCQLLQYLHHENNLGCRFPIGKMDQVQTWPHEQLRTFWRKWYFPANATLYVVGDLDRDIEATKALINKVFGSLPAARTSPEEVEALRALSEKAADGHKPPAHVSVPAGSKVPPPGFGAAASASAGLDAHSNGFANGNGHVANGIGAAAAALAAAQASNVTPPTSEEITAAANNILLKQRHPIRPPVAHQFGYGPLREGETPAPVKIFRHPLLQHFMLSVFCKMPITSMTTMQQLKKMLMLRILLSVFQFRVNKRYVAADPPFIGVELDISDSGREACGVATLTITSEPKDWQGAVKVAVQEMRRLQRHGVTKGELSRYITAIVRDSAQLAQQANKIPSLDTLNFVMESLACGHTVMSHSDAHAAMEAAANAVTLPEVNALARSLLTFASDYGNEAEPLAAAEVDPSSFTHLGPVRATSVVACLPAYTLPTGEGLNMGGGDGAMRGKAMGAAGHIDADEIDLAELEAQSRQAEEFEVPEGAVKFDLSPAEIAAVLADRSYEVDPVADVELPQHLIDPEVIEAKVATMRPRFVPLDGVEGEGKTATPPPDAFSGITQRRLQNGIRVNYRHTDNEPQAALMRLIVPGGRAAESMHMGPDGFGAVTVGTRTLSEAGAVAHWKREQVEVFCIANLINCALEADEENIVKDYHFAVGNGSMQATFELIHCFLTSPVWDEEAMRRAKTAWVSTVRSVSKNLDRGTSERIMSAMLGPTENRRFRDPTPEEIEALTLDGMRKVITGLLHAGALEVNVVGDFDPAELEHNLLRYLGTVPARDPADVRPLLHTTAAIMDPPFEERHSAWHLKDSDERATAYVAGPAPARWGPFGNFDPLPPYPGPVTPPPPIVKAGASAEERARITEARRSHPLYSSCVLMLITEIINSRLFTTVRDSLGLTYDVSFEVSMYDRVRAGWFSVHVTSHPDKIYDALDASVAVLRDVSVSPINRRELARAKTTLLTRHESDLKDNSYWLGLLTHCQNPHVPWKSVDCLRDLKAMYDAITVEDIYHAYSHLQLDDDHLFTCVGTSGKAPPEPPSERIMGGIGSGREDEWEPVSPSGGQQGAGSRGGQQSQQQGGAPEQTPMSLFTALIAAAKAMDIKQALNATQQQQQQQQQQKPPGEQHSPRQ